MLTSLLWANVVECCALLGNVGEVVLGDANGPASSQQRSKRSECRRSSGSSAASSCRRRVNSWTTSERNTADSLCSSRHRRKVSRWHQSSCRHLRAHHQACERWWGNLPPDHAFLNQLHHGTRFQRNPFFGPFFFGWDGLNLIMSAALAAL